MDEFKKIGLTLKSIIWCFLKLLHKIYFADCFNWVDKENHLCIRPHMDNTNECPEWTGRSLGPRRRVEDTNHRKQVCACPAEETWCQSEGSGRAGWGNACPKTTQAEAELRVGFKYPESQRARLEDSKSQPRGDPVRSR